MGREATRWWFQGRLPIACFENLAAFSFNRKGLNPEPCLSHWALEVRQVADQSLGIGKFRIASRFCRNFNLQLPQTHAELLALISLNGGKDACKIPVGADHLSLSGWNGQLRRVQSS